MYRIYCERELNVRITPKKRIKRDKPDSLAMPQTINETGSMDVMHDPLSERRSDRLLSVIDDGNREGLGIVVHRSNG